MELIKLHFSISDALEDCFVKLEGRLAVLGRSSQREGFGSPAKSLNRREERCASFVNGFKHSVNFEPIGT